MEANKEMRAFRSAAPSSAIADGLHTRFRQTALRLPDHAALRMGRDTVTYAALEAHANRLAHALTALGISREAPVALLFERGTAMVVALLATLKAGGSYVPVDPSNPPARRRHILTDCGADVLLTTRALVPDAPLPGMRLLIWEDLRVDDRPATPPARAVDPHQTAYTIYTSGSTGTAKGAQLSHAAVLRLFEATADFSFGPDDVWTLFHSYAFDFSVWELWGALLFGGCLVIVPTTVTRSPEAFAVLLRQEHVTVLNATPSSFLPLADEVLRTEALPALRLVVFGGEALPAERLRPWFARFGDTRPRLVNMYGITETCVHVTRQDVSSAYADADDTSIGRPLADLELHLMDAHLNPTAAGDAGEICVAGPGLARGYGQRPGLTAARFVPHPLGHGTRLYRSGDLGRAAADGSMHYLGRIDQQVQIRGYRVETGEIEYALHAFPGVARAIVMTGSQDGDLRLEAYLQVDPVPTQEALRRHLEAYVPAYMVPATFSTVPTIPLNHNGKIDRLALTGLARPCPSTGRYTAPRNETERTLSAVFADILGVPRVGIDDNLFDMGGHSLTATRLMVRVREIFGVRLPLEAVFTNPNVRALVPLLKNAPRASGRRFPLRPMPRVHAPLSYPQERIWFLCRLHPTGTSYNFHIGMHIDGPLDVTALTCACNDLIARHEIYRTSFQEYEGRPYQQVHPPFEAALQVVDLRRVPEQHRQTVLQSIKDAERARIFDMTRLPLIRWFVFRLTQSRWYLFQSEHHLIHDGWSITVYLKDLKACYHARLHGRRAFEAPLPIQFADYVACERAWMEEQGLAERLAYWTKRLAGCPEVMAVPTDRPRRLDGEGLNGVLRQQLPGDIGRRVRGFCRHHRVTLFMTMLATYKLLLHRYTGQGDLCIGTALANRDSPESEQLIGMLVNTVVVRTQPSGTFAALLDQVKQRTLEAYDHQDVPFDRLIDALGLTRDLSINPLVQVVFSFHDAQTPDMCLGPAQGTLDYTQNRHAKFDLGVMALPFKEQALGRGDADTDDILNVWEFNRDLFDPETVARMQAHYRNLLTAVVADPHRDVRAYDPASPEERRALLYAAQPLPGGYPTDRGVHELFADQVRLRGDAPALIHGDGTFQYSALAACVAGVALRLRATGVSPGDVVAVAVDRRVATVVTLLAIWELGATYLPIDPAYPAERIRYMCTNAGSSLFCHGPATAETAPVGPSLCIDALEPATPRDAAPSLGGTAPAYLMYTSGSTGRPKGVAVTMRSICRLLYGLDPLYRIEGETHLSMATLAFDASVLEVWGPLARGGCLVLHEESVPTMAGMTEAVTRHHVTSIHMTTALFNTVVDEAPHLLDVLKQVLAGGEAHSPAHVARALSRNPGLRLLNTYGPTEGTMLSTAYPVPVNFPATAPSVPIGVALRGSSALIVDAHLHLTALGIPGELVIGGDGLAMGYTAESALTAERFVPDPFGTCPGARLYRTGDRARRGGDAIGPGPIHFLGRMDRQVKIRGFRIEPEEVAQALIAHEAIQDAVVLVRETPHPTLVGYYVSDAMLEAADVLRFLSTSLPAYMLPSVLIDLPALPLTVHGKVDQAALPQPNVTPRQTTYQAPRTPTESLLAALWQDLLGVERVGIHDNFFQLGGHSLLVTRMVARLAGHGYGDLPLRTVFEHPTVAALSGRLAEARGDGPCLPPAADPLCVDEDGSRSYALSPAQNGLWFLHQQDPEGSVYNIPLVFRLDGPLDVARLQLAWQAVSAQHEILRATFPTYQGRPVMRIAPPAPMPLTVTESADGTSLIRAEALSGFNLETGPPVRLILVREAADVHLLCLNLHHIVFDGWSTDLLMRDLDRAYRGLPLVPTPNYADLTRFQMQDPEQSEALLAFWKTRLKNLPDAPVLPGRTAGKRRGNAGAMVHFDLDEATSRTLISVARASEATSFMTLFSCFILLLGRLSGRRRFAVGVPVSGRNAHNAEVLGYFVNTLVLRADLRERPTFSELLARVKHEVLTAFDRAAQPLETLVAALCPHREEGRNPLFQVMFDLALDEVRTYSLGTVTAMPLPSPKNTAKFDLTLAVKEHNGRFLCAFEYATDLYEEAQVRRWAVYFTNLAKAAADTPHGAVDLLPLQDAAARHLHRAAHERFADVPSFLLHELFEAQVARTPLAPALIDGTTRLDYATLNRMADAVAAQLIVMGVKPGRVVALRLAKGAPATASVLGVLKAGCAFLPLHDQWPQARITALLQTTGAACLLTDDPWEEAPCPWVRPDTTERIGPSAPKIPTEADAAIYFTSGSTGTPRGVALSHRALGCTWWAWDRLYDFSGAQDVVVQAAEPSFDVYTGDLMRALFGGGCLVVCRREVLIDPAALTRLATACEATVMDLVPAVVQRWVAYLKANDLPAPSLRLLIIGSDSWHVDAYQAWRAFFQPATRIINAYGLTESGIDSTGFEPEDTALPAVGFMPIGYALPGTATYVLDGVSAPQAPDVAGTLFLGGCGLARGYLGKPGLTAQRFVPDPFSPKPGSRMYDSGDRAMYLPREADAPGPLGFMGRNDRQIKLRGFRIEPGEIETQMTRLSGVDAAVAALISAPHERLVAWYTGVQTQRWVRARLIDRLPAYMVPDQVVRLDALPLSQNGKIDYKALPHPSLPDQTRPLRTADQEVVAGTWAAVLGAEPGLDENFFALGGHSLMVTQVLGLLQQHFDTTMSVRDFFEQPTVRRQAAWLARTERPSAEHIPAAVPAPHYPLTPAQRGLWTASRIPEVNAAYTVTDPCLIEGPLDREGLIEALNRLVARHESLRTVYRLIDGTPRQFVLDPPDVAPEVIDLSHMPQAERLAEELAEEDVRQPIDLTGLPFRYTLIVLGPGRHVLLSAVHHIACDGVSVDVLRRDLFRLYYTVRGIERAPSPPGCTIKDVACMPTHGPGTPAVERLRAWWLAQLSGVERLRLPTHVPHAQRREVSTELHRVPAELTTRLRDRAARLDATPFMVLLSAAAALLHAETGQEDLVLATPGTGRTRPETAETVGLLLHILPLRMRLTRLQNSDDLLAQARAVTLAAMHHQDYPLELFEKDVATSGTGGGPLLRAGLTFHGRLQEGAVRLHDLTVSSFHNTITHFQYDLWWLVVEDDAGWRMKLLCNNEMFPPETRKRLAIGMIRTLEHLADDTLPSHGADPPDAAFEEPVIEFNW